MNVCKDRQTDGQTTIKPAQQHEKEGVAEIIDACLVLFGSSPEVGSSSVTGDVEHSDALQAGQRDRPPVTLAANHKGGDVG